MGVNGLWKLLEPVGRPITLESLENKTLAVDVSMWLNQALYGMKTQHGSTVPNAHLVLLFQRICKLLFYRIKPIFVFDGGVPELKKKTMAARRSMRLSARHKAQKISENVLKKFLKSRAIGSVTGRKSQKMSSVLNQPEPEKDLFELPPLPEEKLETESPSEDGSFFGSHNFQDTEDVNIDSEEFKKLPHEVQHEIIVDMHEKSKRHSRYQDIDMPEESDNFSNFQLKHLLKRGKLTQRLGTIRKEMNEKRAGEVVVDVLDSGVAMDLIVQSQKIMSEETGHYILIKRINERKNDHGNEQEHEEMAGGFFRENTKDDDVQLQPFVLKDLPKISSEVAKPSVSISLDEATSSTGESSEELEYEDVVDESAAWRGESSVDVKTSSHTVSVAHLPSANFVLPSFAEGNAAQVEQVEDKDGKESRGGVCKGVGLDSGESNVLVKACSVENGETSLEKAKNTTVAVEDCNTSNSPNFSENINSQANAEKNISSLNVELDDLEDEIKQKKQLIEKLLSGRLSSTVTKSSSYAAKEDIEKLSEDKDDGVENNDSVQGRDVGGIFLEDEKAVSGSNDSKPEEIDLPIGIDMQDDIADLPPPNEFEGITYEELGEMQMQLDEDLDNLKEERSRQTRLAATVTDEMYKDSQELLQLFGIPFVVSPMEAEAQCANLNRNDMCDGSITEDSDIILFGAKKVYKNIFNQRRNAEVYQEHDVKCVLGLDRPNLIAIALLTGSDYTEGVQGVGIVSAMEIINEFAGEGIQKLKNMKNWLDDKPKRQPQEAKVKNKLAISNHAEHFLESKNISLPNGFPSEQVFEAYLNPNVDDSTEAFSWAKPDLHSLRLFASEKLGWSKTKTDEILLPVLKRLNSRETQTKIDAFFPVHFNETRKIKSRRVKRVVNRLLNKESEDDAEKQTVKKRKVKGSGVKSKNVTLSKETTDIDMQDPRDSSSPPKGTETNTSYTVELRRKDGSSSDSTSDTSDDDRSYIPFNTKVGPARGRGTKRTVRGGCLRSKARKNNC